ncbi:hypothetical protein PR048_015127 [Dryococelus australis]|uniref:Uncharacterized protein n=1 Tax=Dryococelus australis TaxID=614101 RepID=A0ABQ9HGB0_9NEOP|nr:hypothetical protein PR048_015127 [Dryococelus australis]
MQISAEIRSAEGEEVLASRKKVNRGVTRTCVSRSLFSPPALGPCDLKRVVLGLPTPLLLSSTKNPFHAPGHFPSLRGEGEQYIHARAGGRKKHDFTWLLSRGAGEREQPAISSSARRNKGAVAYNALATPGGGEVNLNTPDRPASTQQCIGVCQEARERYGRHEHARLVTYRSYAQGVQCFRRGPVLIEQRRNERAGKTREIPEKTRRPAASSCTIPTCGGRGATPPGVEHGPPSTSDNVIEGGGAQAVTVRASRGLRTRQNSIILPFSSPPPAEGASRAECETLGVPHKHARVSSRTTTVPVLGTDTGGKNCSPLQWLPWSLGAASQMCMVGMSQIQVAETKLSKAKSSVGDHENSELRPIVPTTDIARHGSAERRDGGGTRTEFLAARQYITRSKNMQCTDESAAFTYVRHTFTKRGNSASRRHAKQGDNINIVPDHDNYKE